MAHPAIKVSIIVMAISVIYAYILQIKKDNKADKLRKWVMKKYPEVYDSQPWHHRKMLKSEVVLNVINKKKLIDDEEFENMYSDVNANNKKFYVLLALGIAAIAFIVIASKYFGLEI